MAGEHWNFGFVEAVAAVGDVMADDMLRMRGFSIIGEPVSGSDVGETSSMFSSSVGSFVVSGHLI